MKRLGLGVVGLVGLVVAVIFPSWLYDGGRPEDGYEPTSISSYNATFDVAADGSMEVVETVAVDVETFDRHGIFRFFDRADPNAPELRRQPREVEVLQDGEPAEVEESTRHQGRFVVLKIGDPDRTLSLGTHTYTISYTIDDVLIDDPADDGSLFYWNLVPAGWAQDMDEVRLSVQLPASASEVECAVGVGATAGCPQVSGEGTDRISVSLGGLDAQTPVTVGAPVAQPVPPVEGEHHPWPPAYDPVLGPLALTVLVVLLGLVAFGAGIRGSLRAREKPPGFPLQYAPPPGIGPAQAAYVLDERVGREQFVATVLHAAERGVVEVERRTDHWTIRGTGTGWDTVDGVTGGLQSLVGGTSFTAGPSMPKAGKKLQAQLASFEADTAQWARDQKLVVTGALGGIGGLAVLVAYAVALTLGFWNPLGMSLLAIVPGLFAIGGVGLVTPGSGTNRTLAGRDLWSRVGGFRRVLSTPASKERFDFSGRQDLYTAYIPWAVAFGCAGEWAAKYRAETGVEPPVPAYLGSYGGAHTGAYVDQMVGDFDRTVSAAISSYQATQSSSSSGGGGGGFSGGGGGGGGGGGSW